MGRDYCSMARTARNCLSTEKHTTNNRMELTAAIEGLRALREHCEVEVVTDSEENT